MLVLVLEMWNFTLNIMRSVCAATYGTNQFIESWRAITRRLTQWCFSLHRIFPMQKKKYRSDVQTRSRCSIDRNRIIYLNLWLSIYLHWYDKQYQTISIEKVKQSLELCYGVKNSDSLANSQLCLHSIDVITPVRLIRQLRSYRRTKSYQSVCYHWYWTWNVTQSLEVCLWSLWA